MELSWFSSYLSEHKQFVSVNGKTSDYLEVCCGVHRVLSLVLCCFLITSMICQVCLRLYLSKSMLMILIFFYSSRDLISLQKVMNRELKKVKKWLDANQLTLNIDKTNFVIFHSLQKKLLNRLLLNW